MIFSLILSNVSVGDPKRILQAVLKSERENALSVGGSSFYEED